MITYHDSSKRMRLLVRLLAKRYQRTGQTLLSRTPTSSLNQPRGFTSSSMDGVLVHTHTRPHARAHVLYLPGGAYVHPASALHIRFLRRLSKRLRVNVSLIEYPLAPDNTVASTTHKTIELLSQWMEATTLPIVLMGDSAGGGLALAIAPALRGLDQLVLLSPWMDVTVPIPAGQADTDPAGFFTADELRTCGKQYAPEDPSSPMASPIHQPSLDGLPILVVSGTADLLHDDILRWEHQHPGIHLHQYDGAPHVFPLLPYLPEQRQFFQLLDSLFD